MGEMIDKVKGTVNEAIGNAKQAMAGDGPDRNEKLHAEGEAQEAKGEAQKGVGSVKGALGDKI
ncbi:general stress protein CsbD [Sphingomonas sp. Leaf33]|uniref:CsbD family protein n=1 Tax=Sphingomonas sp. Leaf33 TaxID=1736215 RepID=UPI0006F27DAE|nr:CsbD family protein [Sphingomonas sp. Leaf33]KQN26594.1 general stress protein CsbD [Sphingomonas sp. Leaf33]